MLVSLRNKRVKEGERKTWRIMSSKLRKHVEICCVQRAKDFRDTIKL